MFTCKGFCLVYNQDFPWDDCYHLSQLHSMLEFLNSDAGEDYLQRWLQQLLQSYIASLYSGPFEIWPPLYHQGVEPPNLGFGLGLWYFQVTECSRMTLRLDLERPDGFLFHPLGPAALGGSHHEPTPEGPKQTAPVNIWTLRPLRTSCSLANLPVTAKRMVEPNRTESRAKTRYPSWASFKLPTHSTVGKSFILMLSHYVLMWCVMH